MSGDTTRTLIAFSGFHSQPNYEIELQVLDDPDDLESWTTMAVAVTGDEVASEAAPDELYRFSAALDPMLDGLESRWPQGGLLRVRAVGSGGEVLTRLYADDSCGAEATSPTELAGACGDVVESGIIVTSPVDTLADEPLDRPQFLVDTGIGSTTETDEYYAQINAPPTADDFRTRFGFDAASDVVGTYYNLGDLATGREVRCRPYTENGVDGVACITGNYGLFSGDPNLSLDQAIDGTESGVSSGAFALVAMIYVPPITAPNSVQFVVYGANGQLVNEAQLDTQGDNTSIPQNCLNCHGSNATYDEGANAVLGARFLPFDTAALGFSAQADYTLEDQAEAIRGLNEIVSKAELSIGSQELLDGWYGGELTRPGTAADTSFVPSGWTGSLRSEQTYSRAVAPYCRSCHASREVDGARDPLDFTTLDEMSLSGALIANEVCGKGGDARSHRMPNAQAVVRSFWNGPARAYLADLFDIPGSCEP